MDIFSTNVIDNITFRSHLQPTFLLILAGGFVDIETKISAEEKVNEVESSQRWIDPSLYFNPN